MSREAMQQAQDALFVAREFTELYGTEHAAWVNEKCHEAIAALRAALAEQDDDLTAAWMAGAAEERKRAEQAQPGAWTVKDDGLYWTVVPLYTTPPVPQPLTIERLRDALVASRIIDPGAVEDPDDYDDGVTLHRIEALFRRIA